MWNYFLIIIFNLPLFSSSLMASPSETREDGFLYLHTDSLDKNLGGNGNFIQEMTLFGLIQILTIVIGKLPPYCMGKD